MENLTAFFTFDPLLMLQAGELALGLRQIASV
jgi:hypothetical protein